VILTNKAKLGLREGILLIPDQQSQFGDISFFCPQDSAARWRIRG
jgi:hypothetical protein